MLPASHFNGHEGEGGLGKGEGSNNEGGLRAGKGEPGGPIWVQVVDTPIHAPIPAMPVTRGTKPAMPATSLVVFNLWGPLGTDRHIRDIFLNSKNMRN